MRKAPPLFLMDHLRCFVGSVIAEMPEIRIVENVSTSADLVAKMAAAPNGARPMSATARYGAGS